MVKKLNFNPSLHGFHFNNQFTTTVGLSSTRGLCGGMSLAVFNYYRRNWPIPTHRQGFGDFGTFDDLPAEGTRLREMILNYQISSFASATPFLYLDTNENNHFDWSVREFELAKRTIDANKFVLLGFRSGFGTGHQTLVYGYDDVAKKLFMYDCNFPDEEITIGFDFANKKLVHSRADGTLSGERYLSYFLQLELDANRPDVFTGISQPSYTDLAVLNGITIHGVLTDRRINQPFSYEVKIKNFGEYKSRFTKLMVYVFDPLGRDRTADFGVVDLSTSLSPGSEKILSRNISSFGDVAGVWEIGVAYVSEFGFFTKIPNYLVPNTRTSIKFNLLPAGETSRPNWFRIGDGVVSDVALCKNQDRRIEAFVRRNDNKIYHLFQRTVDVANDCSALEAFNGDQRFDGNVSAIKNQSDCLEIFVRGRDGALWHRWQNRPNVTSTNDWSGWTNRGGVIKSDPEACMNQDNRLEVFAIGTDDRVYKMYHRVVGGFWSGWELMDSAMRFKGRLSACKDGEGKIHVVACGIDNTVWINYQQVPNGHYHGWVPFGGNALGSPVITSNNDGRLEVFVQGSRGQVYHKWQSQTNGSWSEWSLLKVGAEPPIGKVQARPAVAKNAANHIELAITGTMFEVMNMGRIDAAPFWTEWGNRSGLITSDISIACNPGGMIELFGVDATGNLMHHFFRR